MMRHLRANSVPALLFSLLLALGCSSSPTGSGDHDPPGGGGGGGDLMQVGAWMWANPTPQGDPVRRVRFASSSTAYAVTGGGAVLKSIDAGQSWEVAYKVFDAQASAFGALHGLIFLDDNRGWVVGSTGEITSTRDGGHTWNDLSIATPHHLRDVFFHDDNNGFVVGDWGVFFRTSDGGNTWTPVSHPAGTTRLSVVAFTSASVGWAGGDDGTVLYTGDGGAVWTRVATTWSDDITVGSAMASDQVVFGTFQGPTIAMTSPTAWTFLHRGDAVQDVQFTDIDNGLVLYVDAGETFLGTLAGGVWKHDALKLPLPALSVATVGGNTAIVGWWGMMAHSTDGGDTWKVSSSQIDNPDPYTTQLWDVAFTDANVGLAVGSEGTVLRTDDGGVTWSTHATGVTEDLLGVCITGDIAFAVGWFDTAIRSTDGGRTWAPMTLPVTDRWFYNASMWDASNAIMVGGAPTSTETILVTSDGGVTWTEEARDTTTGGVFAFLDVSTSGTGHAWIGRRDGLVVRTEDRGDTWTTHDTGTPWAIQSINFLNETHGWGATRNNDVLYTTDGGDSWTRVTNVGGSIWEVHFGSESNGIGVGSNGDLYGSSDGGATWSPLSGGPDAYAQLRAVWMPSASDGVIVGTQSKILYTRSAGFPPMAASR